jgi:hypothetical protein
MALSALSFLLVVSHPIVGHCESDPFDAVSDSILKKLSAFSAIAEYRESRHDCHLAYSRLYGEDTLSIGIFLGVMDTQHGTSWDRPAKSFLIQLLTNECPANYFACGFTRDSVEPAVLRKTTIDSQDILIAIHDSSVSDRFETSTRELLTEQQDKSKQTTNLFLRSIERDDIVFFVGHSRYGTGPGFSWIRLFSSQWLSTFVHSPVLSDIVRTLDQDATPPKILGVFACSSERHYARDLHTVAPNMALIVSNGMTDHVSNIAEAVNAVNSILGNLCYSESANSPTKLTRFHDSKGTQASSRPPYSYYCCRFSSLLAQGHFRLDLLCHTRQGHGLKTLLLYWPFSCSVWRPRDSYRHSVIPSAISRSHCLFC